MENMFVAFTLKRDQKINIENKYIKCLNLHRQTHFPLKTIYELFIIIIIILMYNKTDPVLFLWV